jgi:hypothetical protein
MPDSAAPLLTRSHLFSDGPLRVDHPPIPLSREHSIEHGGGHVPVIPEPVRIDLGDGLHRVPELAGDRRDRRPLGQQGAGAEMPQAVEHEPPFEAGGRQRGAPSVGVEPVGLDLLSFR